MDSGTVVVELTPEDLKRFLLFGSRRRPFWAKLWLPAVVVAWYFLLRWCLGGSSNPHMDYLPFLVVASGVGFMLYHRGKLGSADFWRKISPGSLLPNTYRIEEEGLSCENTRGRMLHRWSVFTEFVETQNYFYLMLSRRQGHVFPRRSFGSPDEAQSFAQKIRQHLATSGSPMPRG